MANPPPGTMIVDQDPWEKAFQSYQQALVDLDGDGRPDAVVPVPAAQAERDAATSGLRTRGRPTPGFPLSTKSGQQVADEWGNIAWDATGIPLAQSAFEDFRSGSLPGTLSGAGKTAGLAVGALPVVGPIARALGPRAAAGGAALFGGMSLGADEAGSQSRDERRAAVRRRDADAASQRQMREREAEAERLRRDEAERARMARENQSADAAERERLAGIERNKTFQQKYPEWADALPGIGIGVAAGVPFLGKAIAQRVRNAPIRQWDDAVKGATAAAEKGRVAPLNNELARLNQFNATMPDGALPAASQSWAPLGAAAGFGAAAAMEARAFPDQWNAYNLPPENPERQASVNRMLDIPTLAKYGLLGAASGTSGYKAGQWMAPDRRGPIEASKGLTARYGDGTGDKAANALMTDLRSQQQIGIQQQVQRGIDDGWQPNVVFRDVEIDTTSLLPGRRVPGGSGPNQGGPVQQLQGPGGVPALPPPAGQAGPQAPVTDGGIRTQQSPGPSQRPAQGTRSSLSDPQKMDIQADLLSGRPIDVVASQYGVSVSSVQAIARRTQQLVADSGGDAAQALARLREYRAMRDKGLTYGIPLAAAGAGPINNLLAGYYGGEQPY